MTTFASNGLLGSNPGLLGSNPPSGHSTESQTFLPNGLLEPSKSKRSVQTGTEATDMPPEPDLTLVGAPTYSVNGLLPSTAVASSATSELLVQTGLVLESQDDELPPVSEAFGVPSHFLSAPPQNSSSISIAKFSVRATTFDGKSIHFRREPKVVHENRIRISINPAQKIGNLLAAPIHRMMDELSAATVAQLGQTMTAASASTSIATSESTLWVDRYRPQRFTELTGNERVARETMAWVKQWDWCVFGKKKGKKRPREDLNTNEQDEYHRPREKFLLLSGPPGLGKTTLAHIVARQAGYEVMEINASDARSGQIVEDRIRPALEAGSKVGSRKPVLLVIDEIDGATGAGEDSGSFVHKLIQLAHYQPRKKQHKHDLNKRRPILRPIICICNDHNASSLAKLRPHVYQIRFSRPADVHIVKRLQEVCETEGLKAEARALTALAGIAKGDLRTCLNTLQLIKSRAVEVTETIVRDATAGMKEADTSLNSVLNNLFNPLTKKRVKELSLGEEEEGRYVRRLSQEIDGCGREHSIAVGCFTHYATVCQHDANFSKYEQANDWLVTFDTMSSAMYSNGDFALSQYLPYTLIPFYPLFQQRGAQRVERKQDDWENLKLTKTNEEIYRSLSKCLTSASLRHGGNYRHLLSTPILQLEFAPFLNRIISPPLRPINSQVVKPEERALLSRLVDIMAALELRFFQERAEDGQLSYRLDPPIDVFVTYDGKRAADITVSRYAVRHLVAGEIDARLISREADVVEKAKRGKHDYFGKATSLFDTPIISDEHPPELNGAEPSSPANKRAKTEKKDIADKPPTDFFGRLITVPSANTTKAAARKNLERKYRVTYQYTEGNSAAVRKPVKVNTFL